MIVKIFRVILAMVVKVKALNQYIEWSYERSRLRHGLARLSFEILDTQDLAFLEYSRVIWSVIKLRHFISPFMEECIKRRKRAGLCPGVGGWGPLTRVSEAQKWKFESAIHIYNNRNAIWVYLNTHVNMYICIHMINDKNTKVYVIKAPGCYFVENRIVQLQKSLLVLAIVYNIYFSRNFLRYCIRTLKHYFSQQICSRLRICNLTICRVKCVNW